MSVHDEILEAALIDERGADGQEVRDHLAGCAPCRERLVELRRLSRGLDGVASEEREDLTAALAAARADERLSPRFEALLEEHRVRGPRPSRSAASPAPRAWPGAVRILVAAAAVVALVVFGRQLFPTDEPVDEGRTDETYLGGEREPIAMDRTAELPVLRWTFDLPEGGYYILKIVDDTEEARGTIVLERRRINVNRWSPSDELRPLELPREFLFQVQAFDKDKTLLDTLSGERFRLP